ncbi:uncharacterized protein LOC123506564 [Portunus trituberculatus]|uniref:uncharacterized protein LOC123506564 n=1 Tax=Portunus trituberculatus TaxID=210409 RepID=UPI001E1D0F1D|nr:uncharacterized protein LOC123506564 [Portunus trituberculatus]
MHLGDVFPYPAPVTPVTSSPCHASLPSSPVSDSPSHPPPILAHHLGEIDIPESKADLLSLLSPYRSCVSLPSEPLGKTDAVQHSIHLTSGSTPTYVPAYRIPHSRRAMVDDAVRAMLQDDVIEPAASPFNAPLFLVPKSDGGLAAEQSQATCCIKIKIKIKAKQLPGIYWRRRDGEECCGCRKECGRQGHECGHRGCHAEIQGRPVLRAPKKIHQQKTARGAAENED